jgi:hypothetical protein
VGMFVGDFPPVYLGSDGEFHPFIEYAKKPEVKVKNKIVMQCAQLGCSSAKELGVGITGMPDGWFSVRVQGPGLPDGGDTAILCPACALADLSGILKVQEAKPPDAKP